MAKKDKQNGQVSVEIDGAQDVAPESVPEVTTSATELPEVMPREDAIALRAQDAGAIVQMTYAQTVAASEEITTGDLIIPRMRLVQPQAPDAISGAATKGTFTSNLGTVKTEMNVVLFRKRHGMSRWEIPRGERKEPLCKSNDALKPHSDIEHPYCATCNRFEGGRFIPVCSEANWDRSTKPATPPRCNFGYNVLLFDLDESMPFLMRFSKTGIRPIQMFFTLLFLRRLHETMWGASIVLKVSPLIQRPKGSYYEPVFADLKMLSPEKVAELAELRASFARVDVDALNADQAVSAEGTEGEGITEGDTSFDTERF